MLDQLLKISNATIAVICGSILNQIIQDVYQDNRSTLREIYHDALNWWNGLDLLAVAQAFSNGLQLFNMILLP